MTLKQPRTGASKSFWKRGIRDRPPSARACFAGEPLSGRPCSGRPAETAAFRDGALAPIPAGEYHPRQQSLAGGAAEVPDPYDGEFPGRRYADLAGPEEFLRRD